MPAEKIRTLNDAFRTTMTGGRVMMTAGVDALPSDVKAMVIRKVATFSDFTPDNDPHGSANSYHSFVQSHWPSRGPDLATPRARRVGADEVAVAPAP